MNKPLASDSPGREIVDDELRLLGRVSSAITAVSSDTPGSPDYDEALINLRDQLSEAKPEDIPALVEQMTRISALAQRYGKGRDLPVDPDTPYFAHMRLRENGAHRDVLVGKRGFIDRQHGVQIVDWRNAPVSKVYYRYHEGDEYEEKFGPRKVDGTVEARRHLSIDKARLRRIGCPQGVFFSDEQDRWYEASPTGGGRLAGGQGTATRPPALRRGDKRSRMGISDATGLSGDKHLPEIAALIDPAQFELITQPDSGLVVLQGGAGTGKTTVALHRVAYLNYHQPKLFREGRMLVLLPSRALVHYVERVLPALDVRGVRVMTAGDWFARTRQRLIRGSTKRYSSDTPATVLRFKKHPMLIDLCERYVAQQTAAAGQELREAVAGQPEADRVLERWEQLSQRALVPRLIGIRGWLGDQRRLVAVTRQLADSTARALLRRARDVMADWSELLTNRGLLGQAVERSCPGAFTPAQLDEVCGRCTRQSEELGDTDEDGTVEDVVRSIGGDRKPDSEPIAGRFDAPDDALLLYLCLLKRGELRGSKGSAVSFDHIVIDEAQDLSAIELKLLCQLTGKRRSITLAGDSAQRLVFDNEFDSWEGMLERIGEQASTTSTLQLGYRSTAEVMALANSLGGGKHARSAARATRSGAPVELHRFADQGAAVAMLAEALRDLLGREPLASVALITRRLALARIYAHALRRAEVPNLRLVERQDFSFQPGVEITDVSQIKGLEFDYVVVLDVDAASYPATTESRHLLHIAATRAAHQLWLVSVGPPSPLLPGTL